MIPAPWCVRRIQSDSRAIGNIYARIARLLVVGSKGPPSDRSDCACPWNPEEPTPGLALHTHLHLVGPQRWPGESTSSGRGYEAVGAQYPNFIPHRLDSPCRIDARLFSNRLRSRPKRQNVHSPCARPNPARIASIRAAPVGDPGIPWRKPACSLFSSRLSAQRYICDTSLPSPQTLDENL